MTIYHVVWCLDDAAGGLPRAVVLIANSQARRNLSVTILSTTGPGDTYRGLEQLDPRVEIQLFERSAPAKRWAGSRALRRYLRRVLLPTDLVHIHSIWDIPSVMGARAARAKSAPLLVSPHGSLEPHDLLKHAIFKKILGPVLVRPTLAYGQVVCTTPREAECPSPYGAQPPVHTIPLPAGIPPARPGDGAAFRRRLGLGGTDPLMLFLGRIDHKKGLGHLLRALPLMAVPAHLVVVGAGEPAYGPSLPDVVGASRRWRPHLMDRVVVR